MKDREKLISSAERDELLEKVRRQRLAVEHQLADIKTSIRREVRFLPKGDGWILPTVAFAIGLALSSSASKRRRPPVGREGSD